MQARLAGFRVTAANAFSNLAGAKSTLAIAKRKQLFGNGDVAVANAGELVNAGVFLVGLRGGAKGRCAPVTSQFVSGGQVIFV
ncbi:hypothetical protein [Marinobacter sp. SS21]|uniref:hypothetical protein n=1 Tax=Marinobacter sp. SS21 TaxID=2979460 RepID=UPI00232AA4C3|nr:hypothetical protein [Marinobacter sp. SS21]MDC0663811.1 hypothetical protein [Marinobacter sp. SS21]